MDLCHYARRCRSSAYNPEPRSRPNASSILDNATHRCVFPSSRALSCHLQYEKHAWGMDELLPISLKGKNSFAGMGATILDSLSTLWIMGLKDEFARGRDFVNSSLVFPMTTVRSCPLLLNEFCFLLHKFALATHKAGVSYALLRRHANHMCVGSAHKLQSNVCV